MNLNDYPLWTAVITPMKEDGSVDYESLGVCLDQQAEAKNGILILGSTGEALNLDSYERTKILDFLKDKKPNAPIMCGVGGSNLEEQLAWVAHLETLPIDAYLLVVPLYAKPGSEGQYEWFKALMDASTKPCMLYNVPSRTGIDMSLSALERLNTHKNFWAVKEASGSVEKFKEYVKAAGNGRVYSGDDGLLPAFAPHGCKGLVSVAANSWPKQTHRYTELALSGGLKDAKLWEDSANALFVASNPIPVKWLMAQNKTIATGVLRAPLTEKDMCKIEEVTKADKEINNWFNNL
ncbi:MAG: 4-hydroxy-tetrahydrodipicolinate synthase [Bacteriovoracaceae bacterium]|jgi:4-hydroxy-tetrahydrodipicolinate synthase